MHRTNAGEELLDLVDDRVLVPEEREIVTALKFDDLGPRNVCTQVAAACGMGDVRRSIHNERRHPDRRQELTHVNLEDPFLESDSSSWACRQALPLTVGLASRRVGRQSPDG